MHPIQESLEAIKRYNPSSSLYLRVVGEGAEQRLEVVQKNWFGRLLMWLGFTSACMSNVVRYVAKNIDAICVKCFSDPNNFRDQNNIIGRLVLHVNHYSVRHKGKIASEADNIESIYKQLRSPPPLKIHKEPKINPITPNITSQHYPAVQIVVVPSHQFVPSQLAPISLIASTISSANLPTPPTLMSPNL